MNEGACEVCEQPASVPFTDEPAQGVDSYFSWTVENDEEAGIGIDTYEFCSWECLKLFLPPKIAGEVEVSEA